MEFLNWTAPGLRHGVWAETLPDRRRRGNFRRSKQTEFSTGTGRTAIGIAVSRTRDGLGVVVLSIQLNEGLPGRTEAVALEEGSSPSGSNSAIAVSTASRVSSARLIASVGASYRRCVGLSIRIARA
jgi:hypothetical protein